MSYQEELRARLEAAHAITPSAPVQKLDPLSLEQQLVEEISGDFALAQYDLDESDILRSIKISTILENYGDAFGSSKALMLFYTVAKMDVITAKNLHMLLEVSVPLFKSLLSKQIKKGLVELKGKEVFLTLEGQSLAERIGFKVFI